MARTTDSARPAVDCVVIADGTAFPVCAAINASADATATVTFANGSVVSSYQLHKGINPIQATKLASISTGTHWALYN